MFTTPSLWIENLWLSNFAILNVVGLVIALLVLIAHVIGVVYAYRMDKSDSRTNQSYTKQ